MLVEEGDGIGWQKTRVLLNDQRRTDVPKEEGNELNWLARSAISQCAPGFQSNPTTRLRPAPPPLSGKMGKKIGAIEVTKRIRRKASL